MGLEFEGEFGPTRVGPGDETRFEVGDEDVLKAWRAAHEEPPVEQNKHEPLGNRKRILYNPDRASCREYNRKALIKPLFLTFPLILLAACAYLEEENLSDLEGGEESEDCFLVHDQCTNGCYPIEGYRMESAYSCVDKSIAPEVVACSSSPEDEMPEVMTENFVSQVRVRDSDGGVFLILERGFLSHLDDGWTVVSDAFGRPCP